MTAHRDGKSGETLGEAVTRILLDLRPGLLDNDADDNEEACAALAGALGSLLAGVKVARGNERYEKAVAAAFRHIDASALQVLARAEMVPGAGRDAGHDAAGIKVGG